MAKDAHSASTAGRTEADGSLTDGHAVRNEDGSRTRRIDTSRDYEGSELIQNTLIDSLSIGRPRRHTVDLRALPPTGTWASRWDKLSKAWNSHVTLTVPHEASRDNLANERTYLAYLRTSLSMSMMGITITQVLRLERHLVSLPRFSYSNLGKPLGLLFQVAAIAMALVGAYRFWRQQMSMARGKIWAGGWEMDLIMILLFLLMLGVFGLFVVADVLQPQRGKG